MLIKEQKIRGKQIMSSLLIVFVLCFEMFVNVFGLKKKKKVMLC